LEQAEGKVEILMKQGAKLQAQPFEANEDAKRK
jgi:exonuclease VII small subunit